MKIRQLQEKETLKENEYFIETANCGDLAIKLDSQFIHNAVYKIITIPTSLKNLAKNQKFNNFVEENAELLHSTIETEIEYVLDTLALVFCTSKDDFKHIRKNFYKFNNRFEKMIACLISRNIKREMLENYKKEMDL